MSENPLQNAPDLEMRSYFSINYLVTAAHQARVAARIEADFKEFDADEFREHKGAVTSSIFMSIAAVEAYINEVFADCADRKTIHLQGLPTSVVDRMACAWKGSESVERKSTIDKYKLACDLAGKPPLNFGKSPAQDLQVGIQMRNALLHYKPQTIELPMGGSKAIAEGDWKKVCDRLAGHSLKPSPFSSDGYPDFPFRLGHECAEWIVRRAHEFMLQFAKHIGLNHPPFEHVSEHLRTR
ncbi:hypothetical protein ACQUJT_11970 [Ralstonia pseudosolanacearum]